MRPLTPAWESATTVALFLRLLVASFAATVVIDMLRYGVLIYNQHQLLPAWMPPLLSALAAVGAVVTAVAQCLTLYWTARWLVSARAAAYGRERWADPRPPRQIFWGTLMPGVSLVALPVLLSELLLVDPRTKEEARPRRLWLLWTVGWVLGAVLICAVWARRLYWPEYLNANLLWGMVANLWGMVLAAVSIALLRQWRHLGARGRGRGAVAKRGAGSRGAGSRGADRAQDLGPRLVVVGVPVVAEERQGAAGKTRVVVADTALSPAVLAEAGQIVEAPDGEAVLDHGSADGAASRAETASVDPGVEPPEQQGG